MWRLPTLDMFFESLRAQQSHFIELAMEQMTLWRTFGASSS